MQKKLSFTAKMIKGAGRGKRLGSPTINLDLKQVPSELQEGVYAVRARIGEGERSVATMHYGPRPTFGDTASCEVHLLTEKFQILSTKFQTITVEVVERLRDVRKFESEEALKRQIAEDIAEAREILRRSETC